MVITPFANLNLKLRGFQTRSDLRRAPNKVGTAIEQHQTAPFFCSSSANILSFFGHVSRRNDVSIERLVVQGKVEGTRARGRSPMRWTDQVKATIEAPLHECARKATVRE
ncbi:jg4694 [Pararge aegeria aegeria]|uniref:Jg4694 protein n=1 Tax=Pararge aegeria aegeria TaxID=348720 RepID=A0A8S4RBV4_9NEOP|nr:jg4694 [Pararge aegeria aegeria]